MNKRNCALFIAFLICVLISKPALAMEPSEWAKEAAQTAEQLGIGYAPGEKDYKKTVTRAELAYAAVNMHRLLTGIDMALDESDKLNILSTYTDIYINGAFDEPSIALAIKYGLMLGTGDNVFDPDLPVTREQTAVVLYRIAEKLGVINISNRADISAFKDSVHISDYAVEGFKVMVAEGVLTGKSADTLMPKGNCTYEELLTIAVRFWNLSEKYAYESGLNTEQEYYSQFEEESVPVYYSFNWEMDDSGYVFKDIEMIAYMSDEEAMLDMVSVTVNVWNLGNDGAKTPAERTFLVHKDVAEDVISIFDEIFSGPEKFPIYAVSGYSFRGAGSKSSHNNGLAIDINPDENYFINTEGGILAGKYWKPYEDPYSITPDGDVVRAFQNKGWYWGGYGWSTTGYDYMHFSYTGV